MKITAEFNSTDELLSFVSTFGGSVVDKVATTDKTVASVKDVKVEKVDKPSTNKKANKVKAEEPKKDVPEVKAEVDKVEEPQGETKEAEGVEDVKNKLTLEHVREKVVAASKVGKSKEAKALLQDYGYAKVSEVQEKDFEEIYKKAEELING